jgi:periplasmic divalent cation tolerance protein
MNIVVVLTTVGADFDARALAQALVEARVAACVNIVPAMYSVYRWEGRVTGDDEQLLVIKTSVEGVDALREELFRRYPYEVPEFVVLNASASDAYAAWVMDSVGPPASRAAARERRRSIPAPWPLTRSSRA